MEKITNCMTTVPDNLSVMLWSGPPANYIWDDVVPLLEQGKEHFEEYYTIEDLRILLCSGKLVLWTAADEGGIILVMLVELIDFPVQSLVRVIYIGGKDVKKVLPVIDMLHLWAKRHGAGSIEFHARVGWLHLLEPHGYVFKSVNIVRELDDVKEH